MAAQLLAWMETVLSANRTLNLTAIRDERRFVSDHIVDALVAVPLLPARGRVIDVGSGGGFPGVPLALARPDLTFVLLEAALRKAAFLARSGLAVVRARAEEHARGPEGRDAYEAATMRAVAPLATALELGLPLVRPGGRLIVWRGRPQPDEAAVVARVAGRLGGGEAAEFASPLPGRRFLVVTKAAPTPPGFPRRPGLAARRPL